MNAASQLVGDFHSFNVAGITFEDRAVSLATMSVGDTVMLVAERTNRFDPHAIRVTTAGGSLLGYVPKLLTGVIRDCESNTATVTEIDAAFPYIRVSVQSSRSISV
jgi:hypothetical protein